jgi:hypothetical protein
MVVAGVGVMLLANLAAGLARPRRAKGG